MAPKLSKLTRKSNMTDLLFGLVLGFNRFICRSPCKTQSYQISYMQLQLPTRPFSFSRGQYRAILPHVTLKCNRLCTKLEETEYFHPDKVTKKVGCENGFSHAGDSDKRNQSQKSVLSIGSVYIFKELNILHSLGD